MRICFIGDSFVNGTGDPAYLGWVGRICVAARQRGHDLTCYNLGVRRDTSTDIAVRWQDEATRRLPSSIDGRLVFSFGANDCVIENGALRVTPSDSAANARAILQTARERHPTLMVGPPPIALDGADLRIAVLSRSYAALCAELDIPFLDLCTPLAATPLWRRETTAGDGAHPGTVGYALISNLVEGWSAWRGWFNEP